MDTTSTKMLAVTEEMSEIQPINGGIITLPEMAMAIRSQKLIMKNPVKTVAITFGEIFFEFKL
jgi:hypothetical protein